jgi:hypothetical protein
LLLPFGELFIKAAVADHDYLIHSRGSSKVVKDMFDNWFAGYRKQWLWLVLGQWVQTGGIAGG